MRRRWGSTSSTGEICLERMLAAISAMVVKGERSVIQESARVFVHEMQVKREALCGSSAGIKLS